MTYRYRLGAHQPFLRLAGPGHLLPAAPADGRAIRRLGGVWESPHCLFSKELFMDVGRTPVHERLTGNLPFNHFKHLYWLLSISVLKKSAHVGTTSSFS